MSKTISLLAAMGLAFDSQILSDTQGVRQKRQALPSRSSVKRTQGRRDKSQRVRANRRKSNLRSKKCQK